MLNKQLIKYEQNMKKAKRVYRSIVFILFKKQRHERLIFRKRSLHKDEKI
ncbi:hypothetical protein EH5_03490 [Bacillus subtilis]|nr:hypothetical protein EH5_03490 [Bacillus subtilis]